MLGRAGAMHRAAGDDGEGGAQPAQRRVLGGGLRRLALGSGLGLELGSGLGFGFGLGSGLGSGLGLGLGFRNRHQKDVFTSLFTHDSIKFKYGKPITLFGRHNYTTILTVLNIRSWIRYNTYRWFSMFSSHKLNVVGWLLSFG